MSLTTHNDGGGDNIGGFGSGSGSGSGSELQATRTPSIVEGVALTDELQDGENSRELEPGEVVTPPHQQQQQQQQQQPPPPQQQQGNASPALKKMLAKDVMNKALRKLTQIDTDNCEENVRAILELEAIRRKEAATKAATDKPAIPHPLENGSATVKTVTDEADDSEGLYSDTDSSVDEPKDVEDVQKARKEKQAEAAAAAAATPQPAPHHAFIGLSPLRFHMRPPCFDFSRIGFMPRMPRGGMRGMRPSFFNRPPVSNRCVAPRGATPPQSGACNGPQGSGSNSSGAYGPALPPGQAQNQGQGAKRPQSDLLWTTSQPPLSFLFNLVSECGNAQHRDCKQKDERLTTTRSKETASGEQQREHANKKHSKVGKETTKDQKEKQTERFKARSQQRERSKEKKLDSSKERHKERSKDKQREHFRERNEKQRERPKHRMEAVKHGESSREQRRERSRERKEPNNEKRRGRSKEQHVMQRERSREQQMERTIEKPGERSRDRDRPREQQRFHDRRNAKPNRSRECSKESHNERSSHNRHSRSQSRRTEIKARTPPAPAPPPPPPPTQPLPAAVQDVQEEQLQQLTPPRASTETRKAFDIFAESPPRLNKALSPAGKQTPVAPPVERSTTPPLDNRHVTKPVIASASASASVSTPESVKVTPPQLKIHSEIHSRIGALLEDNDDLHLEALLATKEQLLRKSHEHRNKKEVHIKQEPIESTAARWSRSSSERQTEPPRHANPFKRETVLTEATSRLSPRRSDESSRRSMQRNGDRHNNYRNNSREVDSKSMRRSDEFRDRSIKQEKNRSRTPPLLTARQIKVERSLTPPPRDVHLEREVAKEMKREREREKEMIVQNGLKPDEHSPDTDDYIDNWENDDSLAGGDSSTPKNAATTIVARLNGDDDDSNALWNAKSTPPPKAKLQVNPEAAGGAATAAGAAAKAATAAPVPDKALINIHELYDKFMKSIKMGASSNENATTTSMIEATTTTANSSLSNSTATEESSSDTEASSSSSSSSSDSASSSDEDDDDDDDEDDDEDEDEDVAEAEAVAENGSSKDEELQKQRLEEQKQLLSLENIDQSQSQSQSSSTAEDQLAGKQQLSYKMNNLSRDMRKMQSLEDNLARIQMMRENYDSGDEICEELLKMESLLIMQRNAIVNKYRKSDLKPASEQEQQMQKETQQQQQLVTVTQLPRPASPVNNIFDANREAIKLTISPLKLSARKPAIFDKDDVDTAQPVEVKLAKPHKEIAIVKPTIMDTRSKLPPRTQQQQQPHPLKRSRTRERSRSRSLSRNRFRRYMRPSHSKDSTRSPSPRRRRPLASPPLRRGRFGKPRLGLGRSSHSRSISRSRTRSRSPLRRRRLKPQMGRRRSSLSPPGKMFGPRSPPPPPSRRRSYSRERCYSRSPLPFKPPSPPMRRSWSSSRSRSPSRRHSRSRSRTRSRSPRSQSFADYFVENQSMEAAAYYYNMSLMQQDAIGENYDSYAAYMDTAYNMEQAYAQYTDYSTATTTVVASMDYDYGVASQMEASVMPVLRELPKAAVLPVAVQKGNVLEIVPSVEATVEPLTIVTPAVPEETLEDSSKPKRKRVNFVDHVLPNYESDSEDRKVVQRLVDNKVRLDQKRCAAKAAREQRMREQLLALPVPPPPIAAKPANVDKPVLVQKKPRFRYHHFDTGKGTIVKSRERVLRSAQPPRFDPKYMAMLVKSGRLPMPPFMRHRPPPPPAQADAMLQEFFTLHPPPPLHHVMPHYLRGPPPAVAAPVATTSVASQPIPVLGAQSYACYPHTPTPVLTPVATVAAVIAPASLPLPVPVPLPVPMALPVPVLTTPPLTATPPPSLALPFFTPPPLPTLSSHFKVQPVATMREIMPVDILQKIGPLPKTLDLDVGNPSLDEANTNSDLTDAETTSPMQTATDVQTPPPPQLLEA